MVGIGEEVMVTHVEANEGFNNNTASVHICENIIEKERDIIVNSAFHWAANEKPNNDVNYCYNDLQTLTLAHTHLCYTFQEGLFKRHLMILTSETPTLCCPEGTPVWSSASGKYSGNGRHAGDRKIKQDRRTHKIYCIHCIAYHNQNNF